MNENQATQPTPQEDLPIGIIDADMISNTEEVGEVAYREFVPDIRWHADGERATVQLMTNIKARDSKIVDPKGLDVTNFKKNPVMLWHHGWDVNGRVPMGTFDNIRMAKDGKSWLADPVFDTDDFSQMIMGKVKRKVVRALSMGWITHERRYDEQTDTVIITRSELTEVSFVAVGSDPDALVKKRSIFKGLNERLEHLEKRFAGMEATAPAEVPQTRQEPATATPAVLVPPVQTQPTTADFEAFVRAVMPAMQQSLLAMVDLAIDKRTGTVL